MCLQSEHDSWDSTNVLGQNEEREQSMLLYKSIIELAPFLLRDASSQQQSYWGPELVFEIGYEWQVYFIDLTLTQQSVDTFDFPQMLMQLGATHFIYAEHVNSFRLWRQGIVG